VEVAVHLTLLPDGRVLSFGRLNGGIPQVWDPSNGSFTGIPSPSLLFCAGMTYLPAGKLVVVGGHIANGLGLPNSTCSISAPIPGPPVRIWRGVAGTDATMLTSGEILVMREVTRMATR
jgi:hypothetical protein